MVPVPFQSSAVCIPAGYVRMRAEKVIETELPGFLETRTTSFTAGAQMGQITRYSKQIL